MLMASRSRPYESWVVRSGALLAQGVGSLAEFGLDGSVKLAAEGRQCVPLICRRFPPQLNRAPFLAKLWGNAARFLGAGRRKIGKIDACLCDSCLDRSALKPLTVAYASC